MSHLGTNKKLIILAVAGADVQGLSGQIPNLQPGTSSNGSSGVQIPNWGGRRWSRAMQAWWIPAM